MANPTAINVGQAVRNILHERIRRAMEAAALSQISKAPEILAFIQHLDPETLRDVGAGIEGALEVTSTQVPSAFFRGIIASAVGAVGGVAEGAATASEIANKRAAVNPDVVRSNLIDKIKSWVTTDPSIAVRTKEFDLWFTHPEVPHAHRVVVDAAGTRTVPCRIVQVARAASAARIALFLTINRGGGGGGRNQQNQPQNNGPTPPPDFDSQATFWGVESVGHTGHGPCEVCADDLHHHAWPTPAAAPAAPVAPKTSVEIIGGHNDGWILWSTIIGPIKAVKGSSSWALIEKALEKGLDSKLIEQVFAKARLELAVPGSTDCPVARKILTDAVDTMYNLGLEEAARVGIRGAAAGVQGALSGHSNQTPSPRAVKALETFKNWGLAYMVAVVIFLAAFAWGWIDGSKLSTVIGMIGLVACLIPLWASESLVSWVGGIITTITKVEMGSGSTRRLCLMVFVVVAFFGVLLINYGDIEAARMKIFTLLFLLGVGRTLLRLFGLWEIEEWNNKLVWGVVSVLTTVAFVSLLTGTIIPDAGPPQPLFAIYDNAGQAVSLPNNVGLPVTVELTKAFPGSAESRRLIADDSGRIFSEGVCYPADISGFIVRRVVVGNGGGLYVGGVKVDGDVCLYEAEPTLWARIGSWAE
ncbi:MAG: hypothetical protein V1664_04975 [Candidatus Uhrbacteria bacterium]